MFLYFFPLNDRKKSDVPLWISQPFLLVSWWESAKAIASSHYLISSNIWNWRFFLIRTFVLTTFWFLPQFLWIFHFHSLYISLYIISCISNVHCCLRTPSQDIFSSLLHMYTYRCVSTMYMCIHILTLPSEYNELPTDIFIWMCY